MPSEVSFGKKHTREMDAGMQGDDGRSNPLSERWGLPAAREYETRVDQPAITFVRSPTVRFRKSI